MGGVSKKPRGGKPRGDVGRRWRFRLRVGEPARGSLLEAGVLAVSQVAEDCGVERRVRCLAAWGSPKLLFGHRLDHLFARHGFADLFQNRQGRVDLAELLVGFLRRRFLGGRLRRGRLLGVGLAGGRLLGGCAGLSCGHVCVPVRLGFALFRVGHRGLRDHTVTSGPETHPALCSRNARTISARETGRNHAEPDRRITAFRAHFRTVAGWLAGLVDRSFVGRAAVSLSSAASGDASALRKKTG